jgi:hemerythrin superfamily protein
MSPRKSSSGSRSASRTRSHRSAGKSAGRSFAHSRSLGAKRRGASNSTRARGARRAEGSASSAVKLLKQDHRAVAEALEEFESAGHEEKLTIAERICRMLTVHSQLEEELLYPAAREALSSNDAHLVAEARVEHSSVEDLIGQIEDRAVMDEEYEAKVCVLGEYVKHHVSEEEKELFPRLERSSLDLEALGERLEERKRELMGREPGGPGGRAHLPAGLHARRR